MRCSAATAKSVSPCAKRWISGGFDAIRVASPDEYPESRALGITVYRQDFEKLAEQTFSCLMAQNRPGWAASVY